MATATLSRPRSDKSTRRGEKKGASVRKRTTMTSTQRHMLQQMADGRTQVAVTADDIHFVRNGQRLADPVNRRTFNSLAEKRLIARAPNQNGTAGPKMFTISTTGASALSRSQAAKSI